MSAVNGSTGLKVALAVSVALNVFAIAGGVTTWVTRNKVEQRVEDQQQAGRRDSVHDIVAGLDPDVRTRVQSTLRTSALAARPDFEQAREARRQAVELTKGPTLDPAAVTALLNRSTIAEMRGRARIERDAVDLLATLGPQDRQALGLILNRRGRQAVAKPDGEKLYGTPPGH